MITASTKILIRKHTYANAYLHRGKADLSVVISKMVAEQPEFRSQIKKMIPSVKAVIQEINNMTLIEQRKHIEIEFPELLEKPEKIVEERKLPPLSNVSGEMVVTRFPPEPNGYLHIGHAKAAVIDKTYAQMYKGKMILRFDDTNPSKERLEYYDAIREGLNWLGIKADREKNSSDDMELFYKYAEQIINLHRAYVCTCQTRSIKQNRAQGKGCTCRSLSVEKNLRRWRKMFEGYKMNEAILRLKGDIASQNTALRDPTLFRIIDSIHPLKGDQYRVWPTYDFAAPIEDSLDGVTHALRTKEYELRDEGYFLILKLLDLRSPELIEFSRLEIKGTTISKRALNHLVTEGLVKGWDDPRLPTLSALRRRGFLPESIQEFVLSLGVGKSESEPDWSLIESVNRKKLDPIVKRFFFVPNPIKLEVLDAPNAIAKLKYHPEKDFGERSIKTKGVFYISKEDAEQFKEKDMLRLLGLYNVKIESSSHSRLVGRYGDKELKDGVPKVQWVSENNVEFSVWVLGHTIIDGEFNKESLQVIQGFAEQTCKKLQIDDKIQFVRFGFCRIDSPSIAILTHK
jgi:glutamyl-tRNA synthetase